MRAIEVRLGTLGDVDDAASVYERSNLARHRGKWSSRPARVAQITASLHDAAGHDTASWFLIGREGTEAVAMALVHPFRTDSGRGHLIAGEWFLSLIYVLPERWGKGNGGMMLDTVIEEANRRGCHRIYLWTHERQNERAHRLYRSRGFAPTRRTMHDETMDTVRSRMSVVSPRLKRALAQPADNEPPKEAFACQCLTWRVFASETGLCCGLSIRTFPFFCSGEYGMLLQRQDCSCR